MRNFDFSSWQSILTTLIGIALFALVGIGIRLIMMTAIQQRQQRQNRQINERLKTDRRLQGAGRLVHRTALGGPASPARHPGGRKTGG